MQETFNHLLGLDLEGDLLSWWQMSLRAIVVFFVALILIRLGGKRIFGKNAALDIVMGIMLGSILSRAITGNAPFGPVLAATTVLMALHRLLAYIAYQYEGFGKLVKGEAEPLVKDGQLQREQMEKRNITTRDLEEFMRTQGKTNDLSEVKEAFLERNGSISIITRK